MCACTALDPTNLKGITMKQLTNLANFAVGTVLVYIGLTQSDSGYLWNACLIAGGFFIGHVITEALNDHEDSVE